MVLVVLFIFGVLAFIGYAVLSDVNADVQSDPDMQNSSKEALAQTTTQYPALLDNSFVFALGLLWVLAIIASFFVDAHPVFLILAIIVLAVIIFIGASLNNVYAEIADDATLSAAAAQFPKIAWVMDHLVLTILAIAITIVIALYGKNKYG